MTFNSFGAGYTWRFAWRFLWARAKPQQTQALIKYLNQVYEGETHLYYRGRAAISAALQLCQADQILINSFTCYAVEQALQEAQAKVIFADVDPKFFHFDLKELKAAHKKYPKLKAVIIQNTFGLSLAIKPILQYCQQHKIYIIEDLAHSLKGQYLEGIPFGQAGDLVILSFGRGKQIDVVNGGALIVRQAKLRSLPLNLKPIQGRRCWRLLERLHPLFSMFLKWHYRFRFKSLLWHQGLLWHHFFNKCKLLIKSNDGPVFHETALPVYRGYFILQQLKAIDASLLKNAQIVSIYEKILKSQIPSEQTKYLIRFPYLLADSEIRSLLIQDLKEEADCHLNDIWYDTPVAPRRFAEESNYRLGLCPQKDQVTTQIINLPIHAGIKPQTAKNLAQIVKTYSKFSFQTEFTASTWQKTLKHFDGAHRNLLTSWSEIEAYRACDYKVWPLVLYQDDQPVALAVAILVEAKRGRFLKLLGNPLFKIQKDLVRDLVMEKVKEIARQNKVTFIRLQPYLFDQSSSQDFFEHLRSSPTNLNAAHTYKLDFTISPSQIFKSSAFGKARRYIRKAQEVKLKVQQNNTKEALEIFLQLLKETQRRQRFVSTPYNFIRAQFETYGREQKFRIYEVKNSKDELLAMGCILDDDLEAVYLYGASLPTGQRVHAPYLLQWQAINDAYERGKKTYNFWGAAPADASVSHRFYGLSQFKKNFGGQHFSYLETKDLILKPIFYWPLYILEKYEKRRRRL